MFRKMLRHKQQLPDDVCIQILKEEPRGVLSVLGDDGYPYGMPLNHYYSEADGKLGRQHHVAYAHSGGESLCKGVHVDDTAQRIDAFQC